ncbi:MAG TPA: LuxR C-terminal-related transcriptional regulator [Burkholderiaceae bacterium]|nr:LuxR C-terminal-related transcriptional regulator [Burkholderiaceae bacterium]
MPIHPAHHKVYIVDDDASVRDALSWLLRTRRLLSEPYGSAEAFMQERCWHTPPQEPCCLLLDVRMPGMSGLALFERLLALPWAATIPVLFLSGHADVATAVDAVKRGAFDFCEKPFSDNALVDKVEQALLLSADHVSRLASQHETAGLLAQLTERERDVMQRVIAGLPNKLVADELDISVRTVEVHRARIFEKMGVKSAVELANKVRKQ